MVKDLIKAIQIDCIDTSMVVETLNEQSRLKSKLFKVLAVSNPSDRRLWIKLPPC